MSTWSKFNLIFRDNTRSALIKSKLIPGDESTGKYSNSVEIECQNARFPALPTFQPFFPRAQIIIRRGSDVDNDINSKSITSIRKICFVSCQNKYKIRKVSPSREANIRFHSRSRVEFLSLASTARQWANIKIYFWWATRWEIWMKKILFRNTEN